MILRRFVSLIVLAMVLCASQFADAAPRLRVRVRLRRPRPTTTARRAPPPPATTVRRAPPPPATTVRRAPPPPATTVRRAPPPPATTVRRAPPPPATTVRRAPPPPATTVRYPASQRIVGDGHNGRTIDMRTGQELIVRLRVQPSTGYQYRIIGLDRSRLCPQGGSYQPLSGGLVGGTESQTFRFRCLAPGAVLLHLNYCRPFDPAGTPPARVFRLMVRIHHPSSR
jgi:predicted secreted protein